MAHFLSRLATMTLLTICLQGQAADAITLGTATRGGGFELYGRHFVAVLAEVDPRLQFELRTTRGSVENLALLEEGKLDLGLVEGNVAQAAFRGIDRPKTKLRIVAAMYPGPGMFVVRADSAYRKIADLKGLPVAFGTPASGLTKLARDVLDGLDMTPERNFQVVFLKQAGDGPVLLQHRKVAALWGGGIGWPGFVAVAESQDGARFIAPDAEQTRRIRARHPYLRSMTVPAGTYAGQNQPIETVGLWSYVLARADLPEETVYRVLKTLHRSEGALASRLPQGHYTTVLNTANEVPDPVLLHSGTVRYLNEIGLLRTGD